MADGSQRKKTEIRFIPIVNAIVPVWKASLFSFSSAAQ